jgi:hypothetical protein
MKKIKFILLLSIILFFSTCSMHSTKLDNDKSVNSDWEIINSIDKFGDKTNEKQIINICKGTFNNTATLGSKLSIRLNVLKDSIPFLIIQLFEYESQLVSFNREQLNNLDIKLNDGTIKIITLSGDYENYNGLSTFILDLNHELYQLILSQNNILKCHLKIESSDYYFTINPKGLKEAIAVL